MYLYEGDCPEPLMNRLTLVGPCADDYRLISNGTLLSPLGVTKLQQGDTGDLGVDLALGQLTALTAGPYHVSVRLDFSPSDLIHNVFLTVFKNGSPVDELHSVRTGSGVGVIYPQHQSISGILDLVPTDFLDCRLTVPPEIQATIDFWYYNFNIHRIA